MKKRGKYLKKKWKKSGKFLNKKWKIFEQKRGKKVESF